MYKEFSSIQEYKRTFTTKSDFILSRPKARLKYHFKREFDPGSGRTLAACLTHASRADLCLTLKTHYIMKMVESHPMKLHNNFIMPLKVTNNMGRWLNEF